MNRIKELDSLRGIAALTVIITHCIGILTIIPQSLNITPLHFFWAGHEAVIFFFILSGFVLSLPILSGNKEFNYGEFIVKRMFRIYIPYLAAISFTFVCYAFFHDKTAEGLSIMFGTMWDEKLTVKTVLEHVLLIGNFPTSEYNTVIWSLVHEMRISFFFPLIVIFVIKVNWKWSMGLCFVLSGVLGVSHILSLETVNGYRNGYFDTVHYTAMFIIGVLLAKQKDSLTASLRSLGKNKRVLLLIGAFIMYTYSHLLSALPTNIIGAEWGITVGASLFILLALSSKGFSIVLSHRVLVILGELSYSLYLVHIPVIFSSFYLLSGVLPTWGIFSIALPLTLLFAFLCRKYIELPSAKLGRKVKFSNKKVTKYSYNHFR
ncbi:acyltransferase family protein [Heyndrickxia sp. MSNUG]|uniref:acyltransferase family protein n=1 Tax=Heyndrickxia sp. MSNUG TaxID=3136677 RepID=UPI003C2F6647